MKRLLISLLLMVFANQALAAGGGEHTEHVTVNVSDLSALQSGAKWFSNYCLSCHTAQYMRYQRLSEDLELSEEMVMNNLVFADAKIGDTMTIAMPGEQAEVWFGKEPPDLSLIARSRGVEWLYAYLRGFYKDENGRWNNLILENASMPHVMWQLQGIQTPVYRTEGEGEYAHEVVDHLELTTPGLQTPEQFDQTVLELVTFLDYMGEPAKLKRKKVGVWVILFLSLFAFLAYLLKAEYWRDVH